MSQLPTRYIYENIVSDLKKKMVFVGGPRQVGKTTMAQSMIENYRDGHPAYLNWDSASHRKKIRNQEFSPTEPLIVLDEVHKFRSWQNMVKGFYDTLKNSHSFLITGSAKLDHFRKGGDSFLGRYFYYRLHPYSLPELGYSQKNLIDLFTYGGFPEPLVEKNETALARWHVMRLSNLVRLDLRDLENIRELDRVEILAEELPNRVGSPLSIKSLSEDIEASPKTVKRWVEVFESLYYCFRIPPLSSSKIRAVKKEQKLYLWDWSQIKDEGQRFENMIACLLLKYCHYHQDTHGEKIELRYVRDTDKREIDFVVCRENKPVFAVECKFKSKNLSPHLAYFRDRLRIPKIFQVSLDGPEREIDQHILITNTEMFCKYQQMK